MKLLSKTLRVYVILSLAVVVISGPLFYFISNRLVIKSADETLLSHKNDFIKNVVPELNLANLEDWNKISQDAKVEPSLPSLSDDSIFFRVYYNPFENEYENHRVLLTPVAIDGKPYTLFAKVNLIESEDLISNIVLLFCIILFLLLTGLYFITRWLSKRIWLPFYSSLTKIEQFDLDKNVKPDFDSTDVEEFSRLNESVGKLMERNLANYKNQKEFVENAAHELQTPLAIFQARLDVLSQQVPLTQELGTTLTDLNMTLAMLNRLNKNLLLLSKIETYPYNITERVLVSEIVTKQVQFLKEQSEEKEIRVQLNTSEKKELTANAVLAEVLVSNLLYNALRHNITGGEITVLLNEKNLLVRNTSDHARLDPERLFKRFAGSSAVGGNGLGLAIVKKVADLHRWRLQYEYKDGQHIFSVLF